MVVGRSDFSLRAASEALPMRDAFAVLFFVSVGMLLDPRSFIEHPGLIAATLAVIMVGKPLAAWGIVLLLGYPSRIALGVAAALAQIGEFSFILANLGRDLGVLNEVATNTLIAAAIISITVNPLIYRAVGPLDIWLSRYPRLRLWKGKRSQRSVAAADGPDSSSELLRPLHSAVVVGYGPVGQTVARLLRENRIQPTIIELNLDTIRRLRAEGFDAVYGDVRHRDTLGSAGIQTARSLVLSSAGMEGSAEIIRLARELNPDIHILARANYVRQLASLRQAGADSVFSGEGEVALAVTETILRELGATPEQIDRERDRVQSELFGEFSRAGQSQTANGGSADTGADPAAPQVKTEPEAVSPNPPQAPPTEGATSPEGQVGEAQASRHAPHT
jgi:CPA2 family monovalent cation:H+ antiporter-2